MTQEAPSSGEGAAIAQNISPSEGQAPTEQAPEQAPVEPDQPSEPTNEVSQQDLDFTRRFNALARKEREILQREQQFKEQYGQYEGYQKERELLKSDPVGFLEKNGWNFNDLADYVLNDKKKTPDMQVSELQKRIDQLESERAREIEERKTREQQEQSQRQIAEFKNSIKTEVSEKGEAYELINHYGEYDMVYDVIETFYRQNKTILPIDKAAAEVENYLEQRFIKAAETNKFKKRFNPLDPGQSEQPGMQPPSQSAQEPSFPPRTLTNDTVANTQPASDVPKETYLSDEESKRRSAEMLRQHFLKRQG